MPRYSMNGLTKKEKKKFVSFELPVEQAIIVPSTRKADKPISKTLMKKRVSNVKKFLSKKFGGFTTEMGMGGYYSPEKKKLIQEDVAVVTSYAGKKAFNKNRGALLNQLRKWRKKWGQESVGYELEDDLYYIKWQNVKFVEKIQDFMTQKWNTVTLVIGKKKKEK